MGGIWDHLEPGDLDMTRHLIDKTQAGNHGLAPQRWKAQLDELRALPEPAPHDDDPA
jgi:hypothetical protein